MIAAIIFVLGIGCDSIPITDTVSYQDLLLRLCGYILALLLPVGKDNILQIENN